jgi:hypothetical protein
VSLGGKVLSSRLSGSDLSEAFSAIDAYRNFEMKAIVVPTYRPLVMLDFRKVGTPSPAFEKGLMALGATLQQFLAPARGASSAVESSEAWYVDDGLVAPAPQRVQTLRVRLRPTGTAAPRILFDPERD